MKMFRRREPRVDTDAILLQAEESIKKTEEQAPHVNALTTWLNNRNGKNGFGEDFEISLIPKDAR